MAYTIFWCFYGYVLLKNWLDMPQVQTDGRLFVHHHSLIVCNSGSLTFAFFLRFCPSLLRFPL
jgi:hypothetical protein